MPNFATPPRFAAPARRPSTTPVRVRPSQGSLSPPADASTALRADTRAERRCHTSSTLRPTGRSWDLGDGFAGLTTNTATLKKRLQPRITHTSSAAQTPLLGKSSVPTSTATPQGNPEGRDASDFPEHPSTPRPTPPSQENASLSPPSKQQSSPLHKRARLASASGNARPRPSDERTSPPPPRPVFAAPSTATQHAPPRFRACHADSQPRPQYLPHAPRATDDDTAPPVAIAAAFSPYHRRKTRFVPDGWASSARAWILDAAGRCDLSASGERARPGDVLRMDDSGATAAGHARIMRAGNIDVLLVGDPGTETATLNAVVLGAPAWEVEIPAGEPHAEKWVVCAGWRSGDGA